MRTQYAAVGLALVMVLGAAAAVAAVGPTLGADDDARHAQDGSQDATCDYADVFDRTIDSVVSVRTTSGEKNLACGSR
jgi:hypothetical protein